VGTPPNKIYYSLERGDPIQSKEKRAVCSPIEEGVEGKCLTTTKVLLPAPFFLQRGKEGKEWKGTPPRRGAWSSTSLKIRLEDSSISHCCDTKPGEKSSLGEKGHDVGEYDQELRRGQHLYKAFAKLVIRKGAGLSLRWVETDSTVGTTASPPLQSLEGKGKERPTSQ